MSRRVAAARDEPRLFPAETLLWRGGPAARAWLCALWGGAAAGLPAFWLTLLGAAWLAAAAWSLTEIPGVRPLVAAGLPVALAAAVAPAWLAAALRRRARYALTDRRLVSQGGWWAQEELSVPRSATRAVELVRGPFDRLAGTASVRVHTPAVLGPPHAAGRRWWAAGVLTLHGIPLADAHAVYRLLAAPDSEGGGR